MEHKVSEIVFEPPDDDTPGYLRIQREMLSLTRRFENFDASVLDDIVDFMIQFVTEPADREDARQAMMNLSRRQYQQMFDAVFGIDRERTAAVEAIPPQ